MKASTNLRNVDHATERYQELVDLVKFGKGELNHFTENEYIEDKISISGDNAGCDWNFTQHKKIDTKPTLADFKKTVADYLAWEVSQLLKKEGEQGK